MEPQPEEDRWYKDLRLKIATQILAALLIGTQRDKKTYIKLAYEYADLLLEERYK